MSAMRRAVVIQHVAFEDLGTLEPALRAAGYAIETLQAGVADLSPLAREAPELLIALGGPIGVYEELAYPFLGDEIALLRARLTLHRPTLGICLGAQLMAAALGAEVFPGDQGKEIGWSPLVPPVPAHRPNPLAALFDPAVHVLHWHGDTFGLPAEAARLAGSSRYPHQAFSVGNFGLALQFHAEAQAAQLERWYIGHASELAQAGISVPALRDQARRHGPALERAAATLWQSWLRGLEHWEAPSPTGSMSPLVDARSALAP
ncbi:MAG: glutamine amidotransferase [Steroidobacteraceae bacterium]